MAGELGADGDDEVDDDEDDGDMLLGPSPLNGAKVAPWGELASPERKLGPIRSSRIFHLCPKAVRCMGNLPLAVAGDKLRPVGGPVDDEPAIRVPLRGVVGVSAKALWWFSVWRRNERASQ